MRIIAGPCQHESLEKSMEIAEHCADVCSKYDMDYYFKASYDKANRTHVKGYRGVGINTTMHDFLQIKKKGIKTLTDVHSVAEVYRVKYWGAVNVIQIPAFLSRQTDLLQAARDTGLIVNIKKGQFMAPWDLDGVLSKMDGAREVWLTERGTSFGYNNLVVDFNGLQYMLGAYGDDAVVFDGTHSVQQPSANGTSSGGNREYVPGLLRSAAALGVRNFFLEVHPNPDDAPSDGPNMVRLDDFEEIVNEIDRYSYSSTDW